VRSREQQDRELVVMEARLLHLEGHSREEIAGDIGLSREQDYAVTEAADGLLLTDEITSYLAGVKVGMTDLEIRKAMHPKW
jgi:hypothetical protein